jgi:cytochrome P450
MAIFDVLTVLSRIVAGSDTTSTALSNAIYYLICHRHVLQRLRAELDAAVDKGVPYDMPIEHDRLSALPYLQAVVNETLRLQPALPNGIQRTAPHESGVIDVAGWYVLGAVCMIAMLMSIL